MAVFFSTLTVTAVSLSAQGLELLDRDISRVVRRISDAVVTVEARQPENRAPVFPGARNTISQPVNAVVGTGMIIDTSGYILTSLGMVDGYDRFRIETEGRNLPAKLVGVDRMHKLAVLKVDTIFQNYISMSPFPPTTGRLVLAYGQAIGHIGYPALGIIAGRQSDGSYLVSGSVLPGLLGGGVFDLSGKLLGVISSGSVTVNDYRGTWGGIIMLPAATSFAAADWIICCGNREAGYLGIRTAAIELVSPEKKILGEAVVVLEVDPGSPADKAGLLVGDIVTRFGGGKVTSDSELQRLVGSAGADSTINIGYMRGQQQMNIRIALTSPAVGGSFVNSPGLAAQPDRQTLIAIDIQKRIDLMHLEVQRLQKQLDRLLGRAGMSR